MTCKSEIINSASHKTVLVIDRSKRFCQKVYETTKLFNPNDEELTPGRHLSRWSVAIQGVFEFQRILSDIYPYGSKQVRLCVSDTAARFITSAWQEKLITYNEVLRAFLENQPDLNASSASASILNGLNMTMDALTAPTIQQAKILKMNAEAFKFPADFNGTRMPAINDKKPSSKRTEFYKRLQKIRPTVQKNVLSTHCLPGIENSGTILVFTSVDNLDKLKEIVTFVEEQTYERNELYKATAQTDLSILPVSQLRLLIVHIDAADEPQHTADFAIDCKCYCQGKNGIVKPSIYFAQGTASITQVVHEILCANYGILSTTITHIPMKEESAPNKSQNYNVEIFHSESVHSFFKKHDLLQIDSPIASRADTEYVTAKLKWSNVNNRFNASEPPLFSFSSLATSSLVRSRPANCFCSFLLNGKNVLLDVNSYKPLPMITINFSNTTISHFCTADINNGALTIKCMSFDLADSYKLLSKHKFADTEINSYKNLLMLKRIEPTPIKNSLIDQNPRPMFEPSKPEKPLAQIERPLRSESPAAKRAKLQQHNWVMNETINLREFFEQKQERNWINWRDFVGRQNAPDKLAILYPNLEERTEAPIGGVRPNRRPRPHR